MFGNFIGDGVRGSQFSRFPSEVSRGIQFHRFIDSYTDQHPEVMEAKKLFYPTQSKFSGVVVDVLFDHLLALGWDEHHQQDLPTFASHCYRVVEQRRELLPIRSERFFHFMKGNDILPQYASKNGIRRVFQGMDGRTKFTSNMTTSIDEAQVFWRELEGNFKRFFPDLVDVCMKWKTTH